MSLPPELVTAALVGTDRAATPPADRFPLPLEGIIGALSSRPAEESLLLMAAAAALHDAAGRLPQRPAGVEWHLPAYVPEGDLSPSPSSAAHFLERMLNQRDTAFLPELLVLTRARGFRIPDNLLPHVLEYGAKIARQRPLLWPIMGERGRWLAALNPAWRYAAVDFDNAGSLRGAWEADPSGRASLAIYVRDRDPAKARRLIETTWRSESDVVRREMLGALEQSLSLDDEPFLERALDDRDVQVRRKAVELLAAIPGSRLVQRITTAAGKILVLRKDGLVPVFPGQITERMVRDGIVRNEIPNKSAPPRTASDWSRLLVQTVGVIPLSHWTARFSLEPEELIRAAQAGKWPRTLITAFATAALRQKDYRWIDALLTADDYSERTGMLLAALEPEDCYARLAGKVAAGDDIAVTVFLRRWPNEWDEASGRLLIDFLGRQAETNPDTRISPTLRYLSRQFAHRCPPELLPYAIDTLGKRKVNGAWEVSLRHIYSFLSLRREMRAALEEPQAATALSAE